MLFISDILYNSTSFSAEKISVEIDRSGRPNSAPFKRCQNYFTNVGFSSLYSSLVRIQRHANRRKYCKMTILRHSYSVFTYSYSYVYSLSHPYGHGLSTILAYDSLCNGLYHIIQDRTCPVDGACVMKSHQVQKCFLCV